jgi:hypothetical protein
MTSRLRNTQRGNTINHSSIVSNSLHWSPSPSEDTVLRFSESLPRFPPHNNPGNTAPLELLSAGWDLSEHGVAPIIDEARQIRLIQRMTRNHFWFVESPPLTSCAAQGYDPRWCLLAFCPTLPKLSIKRPICAQIYVPPYYPIQPMRRGHEAGRALWSWDK